MLVHLSTPVFATAAVAVVGVFASLFLLAYAVDSLNRAVRDIENRLFELEHVVGPAPLVKQVSDHKARLGAVTGSLGKLARNAVETTDRLDALESGSRDDAAGADAAARDLNHLSDAFERASRAFLEAAGACTAIGRRQLGRTDPDFREDDAGLHDAIAAGPC